MSNSPLVLAFRHRSSLVLAGVFPVAYWALTSAAPTGAQLAVGGVLLAAGASLRLWAARCLGKGARVHTARARDGVVDWGPYAWSRNPLYVAAGLILAGLGLFAGGGWWGLLLLPGTLLVYTPVVAREERAIREGEGAPYLDYQARVSRWFGLPARRQDSPPEAYPWKKVLRREVGLIPGLVSAAVGLLLVQRDVLPLRSLAEFTRERFGVGPGLLAGILLAAGAIVNSVLLERKHRRRRARRAELTAAPGVLEPSSEVAA